MSFLTLPTQTQDGGGIPDSVTNHYRRDEGSGSTLNGSEGAISLTHNGTWVTGSQYQGDAATDYDGVNGDAQSGR